MNTPTAPMFVVPVLAAANIRSWPKYADGGRAVPTPLTAALTQHYPYDAHLAQYACPTVERRLAWETLETPTAMASIGGSIRMSVLLFDVDHEDSHSAGGTGAGVSIDDWWALEAPRVTELRTFVYRTRGGYRIVLSLVAPFVITNRTDAVAWTEYYLCSVAYLRRVYGITADPTADWQRLFRVPHATRLELGTPGETADQRAARDARNHAAPVDDYGTIGDPHQIATWAPVFTDEDVALAATLRRNAKSTAEPRNCGVSDYGGEGLLFHLFNARGWVGHEISDGKFAVLCPRDEEHTRPGLDGSTVLFPPGPGQEIGWLHCSHTGHGHDRWTPGDVLAMFSSAEVSEARVAAEIPDWNASLIEFFEEDAQATQQSNALAPGSTPSTSASNLGAPTSPAFVSSTAANAPGGVAPAGPAWEPPVPFVAHDLPPFPVHVLSPWLRAWAEAEADATQTPVDLAALLGLAVVALAMTKRFEVFVKSGWRESSNIYVVIVLASGEGKSPVFKSACRPLWKYEEAARTTAAPKIAEANERRRSAEKRLDTLRRKAANTDDTHDRTTLTTDATQLAVEIESMPRVVAPRLIADDATPEALSRLLSEHGERMGLFSSEGGPFEIMGGRYSDGRSNIELLLKSYSGDPCPVDRAGSPAYVLRAPLLTVALTVQPNVITGLAAKPEFRGRGLLGRFIFSLPRSRVGTRHSDPPSMPMLVSNDYHVAVSNLLNMTGNDGQEPVALHLADDARHTLLNFKAAIEPRLGPDGDLNTMADWGNKLTGNTARFAGLLHVADHTNPVGNIPAEIAVSTVERAIAVAHYAIEHARATFNAMAADPATEDAKHVLEWIRRQPGDRLSRRTIHRGVQARLRTASELDPALLLLEQHGYVRPTATDQQRRGRPPSPTYDVNPLARGRAGGVWLSSCSRRNAPESHL